MLLFMRLPVPSPQEVETFKQLYRRRFGVELTPAEALEVSTRFLQLYFLKAHAIHSIHEKK